MDIYSIFDEYEEDKTSQGDAANEKEESFIAETPLENVERLPESSDENEINDPETVTPFPVSEADPLGIIGNAEPVKETGNTTENTNQPLVAMKFDLPEHSSLIKVIGVGGGGSNAVNHMYRQGINGVDFVVCNTDKQALDMSPVPHKIVLGATLTEGRGAGSLPEVGRNAAIENIEDIRRVLANNTKMVFITAGMGGGTGTGAAPIIAGIAREMGILTVAIVTVPFLFEGKKRRQQAEQGLEQLKQNVDTLLVICNDKLREMYGNLKLSDAFSHADDVLAIAAKSIAEIISLTQQINVDFADVCTVMRNSGVAIMGSASVSGENRSIRAVEMALNSPLLNDNNITGARYVLLNIVSGANEITMDELGEITDYIQEAAGQTAEIIKGYGVEPELGDNVNVTIIATGFNQNSPVAYEYSKKPSQEKVVLNLEAKAEVVEPVKESSTETVNPLEPFLVSKQPEPVAENKEEEKPVADPGSYRGANPLEPFLVTKQPEVSSDVSAPGIKSFFAEPVAEVPQAEETVAPVAETQEPVAESWTEEAKSESLPAQEEVAPLNTNVEFEITNFSAEEESSSWETSSEETPVVNEISSEPVAEMSAESSSEPVAEVTNVEETVSEISSVETPVAQVTNEPVLVKKEEPVAETKQEEPVAEKNEDELAKKVLAEELQRKAQDRIQKLKELSLKLKTPQGLNEMEHEPAYKRRNISLDNVPHSSESQVSRYTLTENEDKKVEIRPNNSFLHDNVD